MFIAVTRLFFEEETREAAMEIVSVSRPVFEQQNGLVSIQALLSHDDTHIVTILEWQSKEDHEKCMTSKDWEAINKNWEELLGSGKARFELNTYDVLSS